MTDVFTKEKRSEVMSKIRSKNTKPERVIRDLLRGTYLRYHPKGVLGNPDFASKSRKIAVFIDGCFWHKCPIHFVEPKSNQEFWMQKIMENVEKDRETTKKLKSEGWTVIRIWEHEVKENPPKSAQKILKKYENRRAQVF